MFFRVCFGVCCGYLEMLFVGLFDKFLRVIFKDKLVMNVVFFFFNSLCYILDS